MPSPTVLFLIRTQSTDRFLKVGLKRNRLMQLVYRVFKLVGKLGTVVSVHRAMSYPLP